MKTTLNINDQAPTPTEHAVAFADTLLKTRGVLIGLFGREWPTSQLLCLDKKLLGRSQFTLLLPARS